MKLQNLISAFPCEIRGVTLDTEIESLEYDSRKSDAGTIFFCLPGARSDGHDFAMQAYSNGCRAFVLERYLDLPDDAAQLKVSRSREALAFFSAKFFGNPAKNLILVGITGTKGKTTTAIMIREILCRAGLQCAYIGSNGVDIGEDHYETANTTPESRDLHRFFRMMLDKGVTHAVIEVSSQALCNYRIAGIDFDTVIYTNLSPDHIGEGEHSSFEEYRDAKRKLFTDYKSKNIVYNSDDKYAHFMISGATANLVSYSVAAESDFKAENIRPYREKTSLGIDFDVLHDGIRSGVRLRTPGKFSAENGLAAIAAASLLGVSIRQSSDALSSLSIKGRFEIVDAFDEITFIIDYAHNGISLTHALSVLREYSPSRLICVFGTVGGRTFCRRKELAEAASKLADFSIITSDNPDFESPSNIIEDILSYFDKHSPYTVIEDREEAVRFAVNFAEKGDIVLFAGKGHENYQLIKGKKLPFSERAIILDEAAKVSLAVL